MDSQIDNSAVIPHRAVLIARSLIFWLIFFVSTVLLAFPVIIASFFSYRITMVIVMFWVNLNLKSLEIFCRLFFKVEGEEHVPNDPFIIFAKHQSTWETLFLQRRFPGILYVAKRELTRIPFFGWALSTMKYVMIDRGGGRKAINQMIEQYTDRKSRNLSLVVFPEGTRKPVGAEPDYKIGGAVVAVETGTPVLPVAHNAGEFWPRHSFIKWPGQVSFAFGPVIHVEGKTPDQVRNEARDWIEHKMESITKIDRFPY